MPAPLSSRVWPVVSSLQTSRLGLERRTTMCLVSGEPDEHAVFPSRDGGTLTRDAIERRLAQHVKTAQQACVSLRSKRITMHTMRHTAAMNLLTAGVDTSTIALWLGHEQERTTHLPARRPRAQAAHPGPDDAS
jgi:integrase/recombinase XerD